jgi:hypothetical protein
MRASATVLTLAVLLSACGRSDRPMEPWSKETEGLSGSGYGIAVNEIPSGEFSLHCNGQKTDPNFDPHVEVVAPFTEKNSDDGGDAVGQQARDISVTYETDTGARGTVQAIIYDRHLNFVRAGADSEGRDDTHYGAPLLAALKGASRLTLTLDDAFQKGRKMTWNITNADAAMANAESYCNDYAHGYK